MCCCKSPSKEFISKCIVDAFACSRDEAWSGVATSGAVATLSETLEIDAGVAEQLLRDLGKLVARIVADNLSSASEIESSLFATSGLPANLRTLLAKLLLEQSKHFRQQLLKEKGSNIRIEFETINNR